MIKHGYNDNKAMFAIDNDVGGKIMITKKTHHLAFLSYS